MSYLFALNAQPQVIFFYTTNSVDCFQIPQNINENGLNIFAQHSLIFFYDFSEDLVFTGSGNGFMADAKLATIPYFKQWNLSPLTVNWENI